MKCSKCGEETFLTLKTMGNDEITLCLNCAQTKIQCCKRMIEEINAIDKKFQTEKETHKALVDMGINTLTLPEQIQELLKRKIKVESAALGRIGQIIRINGKRVYIKLRNSKMEGVTTFSRGDKVVLRKYDDKWVVENDWNHYLYNLPPENPGEDD